MRRWIAACAVVVVSGSVSLASAKDEVRRDPNGVKGISPYNEDLAKGREASKKGDHVGAIGHFDAAIAKADGKMLAHLLKAQSQLLNGDREAAIKTTELARSKDGTEEQHAKVTFLAAELTERKADTAYGSAEETSEAGLKDALASKWEAVKTAWKTYAAYVAEHTRVPNYAATSDERVKKVDERVKRDKDYGEVKVRIAQESGPGDS